MAGSLYEAPRGSARPCRGDSAAPAGHRGKPIIYGEDLAGTGLTAAELDESGKAYGQWAAIEKNLIERVTRAIASRNTNQR